MIPVTSFKNQKLALFGLGGSGFATARALIAGGADVTVWDDNPDSVEKARSEGLKAEDLRKLDWSGLAALILAPGVPLTHPKPHWSVELATAANVAIIGDVELFVRERRLLSPDCPFIAITGTNGKSTTTALIAHILRESGRDTQMGGNIGTAVLTLAPPQARRFYVIECSSYQIDLAPTMNPTVGILLNLTPDHLDRHGDMQHYADIKDRLVEGSDIAVVGVDDSYTRRIAKRLDSASRQVIRISKSDPVAQGFYNDGHRIFLGTEQGGELVADLNGIPTLRGSHNAQNAAAAIAACLAVGLSEDEVRAGLASFAGLKHRMQPVGRRGKVVFVNDSKATNAEAAAPALSSYDRIYWIAGGVPKVGGIASLSPLFSRIAKAYLIGEAASAFATTLGNDVPFEMSGTLEQAVRHAAVDAEADGADVAVMLSPACASFDQYKNFEVRGDAFVALIAGLKDVTMLVQQVSGEQ